MTLNNISKNSDIDNTVVTYSIQLPLADFMTLIIDIYVKIFETPNSFRVHIRLRESTSLKINPFKILAEMNIAVLKKIIFRS